jgi:hypothetical protein
LVKNVYPCLGVISLLFLFKKMFSRTVQAAAAGWQLPAEKQASYLLAEQSSAV